MFSSPYWWWEQDGVFAFPYDPFLAIFAIFGLTRLWKKERLYVLWLIVGLAFLAVWPTKWPQYIIILSVPLSLAAAEGFMVLIVNPLKAWWGNRKDKAVLAAPQKNDLRHAWAWLIPGLLAFIILTLFPLIFQVGVSLTDFSTASIRDGFQGGLWRDIFEGLTGQIPPYRSSQVNFIGPGSFIRYLGYINSPEGDPGLQHPVDDFFRALQTALGLGAALLLWQRGIKLRRGWEMLFILPWAIPEMIGALMWFNVFAPTTGWLSLAVQTYGEKVPFGFLLGWQKTPTCA